MSREDSEWLQQQRRKRKAKAVNHDEKSGSPPKDVKSDMVKNASNAMPTKDFAEEECDKAEFRMFLGFRLLPCKQGDISHACGVMDHGHAYVAHLLSYLLSLAFYLSFRV